MISEDLKAVWGAFIFVSLILCCIGLVLGWELGEAYEESSKEYCIDNAKATSHTFIWVESTNTCFWEVEGKWEKQ